MTTNMDDKGASRTTAQDHLRSMLDLMRQGARVNLSGIPDDPTFLSSNIPGEIAKEIAALIQSPADAGVVKPLEWERGVVDWAKPLPGMKYVACSTTPKGSWAWWLDDVPETRGVFASEEEAKAAAQADYERRILSALTTPKPKAVKACATEGCENPATVRFERHGVGSDYCRECYLKVQAIRSTTYGYETQPPTPASGEHGNG